MDERLDRMCIKSATVLLNEMQWLHFFSSSGHNQRQHIAIVGRKEMFCRDNFHLVGTKTKKRKGPFMAKVWTRGKIHKCPTDLYSTNNGWNTKVCAPSRWFKRLETDGQHDGGYLLPRGYTDDLSRNCRGWYLHAQLQHELLVFWYPHRFPPLQLLPPAETQVLLVVNSSFNYWL